MNLYLISQSFNNDYDTYDSAVVAAKNEEDAKQVYPGDANKPEDVERWRRMNWASPEHVDVTYIGTAKPGTKAGTVICASFNAG